MAINKEREDILRKVKAIIAKADSTNEPAEADTFRAKADALMLRYSIGQHELASDEQASRNIQPHDYDMGWYQTNPNKDELWLIMRHVATHCRVALVHWEYTGFTIPAVGSDADFSYFDMLFTNVMLEMSKGLEPHPDPAKPMIENLVAMKEAGMKWERIGDLLYGIGQLEEPYTRNTGVKFTKLYTDYCLEHQRPRLRTSPAVYSRSFAKGFALQIADRLHRIRREAEQMYDSNTESTGTELVLADMKRLVDARVRQLYGSAPASRYRGRADNRKIDHNAVGAGREAANKVNLGSKNIGTTRREIERG